MPSGIYTRKPNIKYGMTGKHHSNKTKKKIRKTNKKYRGERHSCWKGGRRKTTIGYIYIWKPNHPFATKMGYVYEHHLIMEQHLGRFLKLKEVVHHTNGVLDDNRIENLKLFKNNSKHQKFHHPKGSFCLANK